MSQQEYKSNAKPQEETLGNLIKQAQSFKKVQRDFSQDNQQSFNNPANQQYPDGYNQRKQADQIRDSKIRDQDSRTFYCMQRKSFQTNEQKILCLYFNSNSNEDLDCLINFYRQMTQFQKNFSAWIESLESSKQTRNVWGQFIIRVLGKNKTNYCCLPLVQEVQDDKSDFLKHLQNQTNDSLQIEQVFSQILNQITKLNKQFLPQIQNILQNQTNFKAFASNITFSQEKSQKIGKQFQINVDSNMFQRLEQQLLPQFQDSKLFLLFHTLFNYDYLGVPTYQWSVPPQLKLYFKKQFNCNTEFFGSPFNTDLDHYYCLFYHDQFFGGKGSFYQLGDNEAILAQEWYQCNPPFTEQSLNLSSKIIESQLKKQKDKNIGVFCIFPWKDLQGYKLLTDSEFLIQEIKLGKFQHKYFDSFDEKVNTHTQDTFILIVGTQQAQNLWDSVKQKAISEIKKIFNPE